jgi:hypothetical protein
MIMSRSNIERLRHITPEALAALGAPELAYIKAITTEAGPAFGVFAADGSQIGVAHDRDLAFAAARQNGLEPVSVH